MSWLGWIPGSSKVGTALKSCKYTCTITWAPASIPWGTPLTGAQLNAVNSCRTAMEYRLQADGSELLPGGLSPDTPGDYDVIIFAAETWTCNEAGHAGVLRVTKRTPTIEWNPSETAFAYGGKLSRQNHLNARAVWNGEEVPGTMAYTLNGATAKEDDAPGAGNPALVATFTPADPARYETPAPATRTLQISKVKPVFTWDVKASDRTFDYGTALSNDKHLHAAVKHGGALVSGAYTYTLQPKDGAAQTVSDGFIPSCGKGGVGPKLSVSFAPADSGNYEVPDPPGPISLMVKKVEPVLALGDQSPIPVNGFIEESALVWTATHKGQAVKGTVAIKQPNSGKLADAAPFSVEFSPEDTENYKKTTAQGKIKVAREPFHVTWSNPADIDYGTFLSKTQLCATFDISNPLVTAKYSPTFGHVLEGGTHDLHLDATTTSPNYSNPPRKTVQIKVNPVMPTIVWNPEPANPSSPLTAAQLNATVEFRYQTQQKTTVVETVEGTYAYNPNAPTATSAAAGTQILQLTFTPTKTNCFLTPPAKSVTLQLMWATPAQLTAAKVSDEKKDKILRGKVKKDGTTLIGAHSRDILADPVNYRITNQHTGPNGVTTCMVAKKKPDGSWTNAKFSSLPPAGWDNDMVMKVTVDTGNAPVAHTDGKGNTTHRLNVSQPGSPPGGATIPWEVIKDPSGKVTASYPG